MLDDALPAVDGAVRGARRPQRPPQAPTGALEVAVLTSLSDAQRLAAEWEVLHTRSATTNPFTHPGWALAWAQYFVAEEDLFVVTVRRAGILVGVAPFYWIRMGPRRRSVFRSLHLLGNGRCAQFTEIPGIVAEQGEHRQVLATVITFLQDVAPSWDWVKLTIDAQQGWFEPQWLSKHTKADSAFDVAHATRACVVLDLPRSWEEFLSMRKKNVRESIRRSTNRLTKRVGNWSVDSVTEGAGLTEALSKIVELHTARSDMAGKPNHPTMFGPRQAVPFYLDAVRAMARSGQAEVSVLRCNDETLAGLVTLRANSQAYTSATGADPAAWQFGPGTILIAELARREIQRGTASINLSAGPNQSKLRWSERLEFNHDFVIVGPRGESRARFAVYSQLSNLAALRRAMRWDTVAGIEGT